MMTSTDAFLFFSKFWFSGVLGGGGGGKGWRKGQKMALNDKEIVSLHISGTVPDCGFR